jgi:two-component system, response regulator PdtaR
MDAVAFMGGYGFAMYEAGNADEAIALLELHDDIRAVFTDINMPGSMDGLKLAHYVRGRWPPIKLIITSGQAKPLAEDMPVGSGFIAKPLSARKCRRRFARDDRLTALRADCGAFGGPTV